MRRHRGVISEITRSRAVMAAALVVLCGLCYAKPLPVSRVTDSPVFATDDEAAVAALGKALRLDPTVEWGGLVFQLRDGGYVYSDPVTSERREVCGYRGEAPAGSRLVGIYHTHPQH